MTGRQSIFLAALLGTFVSSAAFGGDADRGREIAQRQCAACHIVGRDQGHELANAPPFEIIGRKNAFDERALTAFVRGPHPKMNFALTELETGDVAAYISALAK